MKATQVNKHYKSVLDPAKLACAKNHEKSISSRDFWQIVNIVLN